MADAFTVNLNLTKPEVGASSATWGTKLNTDLDVVDSLFSAASTVAYSMKIGAANTLTVAGLVTGTGTINLLSAVVSVGDANFSLKDTGDSTRIVKFELGGLTTSTTRTITFPDADITLVGAANTQTLTNKTLTNAVVGTQTASDNSTKAASTAYVDTAISVGIPAGVYLPYGGAAAPTGWLLCYGQAISRTTYATLFTAIATAYGVGDGTTTFNVPDMRGRAAVGLDNMGGSAASRLTSTTMTPNGTTLGATGGTQTHTLVIAEMPSHSHTSNAWDINGGVNPFATGGSTYPTQAATINSTGGGGAHLNVQPSLAGNYIIKT